MREAIKRLRRETCAPNPRGHCWIPASDFAALLDIAEAAILIVDPPLADEESAVEQLRAALAKLGHDHA